MLRLATVNQAQTCFIHNKVVSAKKKKPFGKLEGTKNC